MTDTAQRSAQIGTFSSLGALTVTQELSGRIRQFYPDFDEELVAEETLCFVASVSAFSIRSSADNAIGTGAASALDDLPYTYRDYVLGQLILADSSSVSDGLSGEIGSRLGRKLNFYHSQLSAGLRPNVETGLSSLAVLWMGRISQPGRPESPDERVKQLEVVDILLRHMTLLTSFASHASA